MQFEGITITPCSFTLNYYHVLLADTDHRMDLVVDLSSLSLSLS